MQTTIEVPHGNAGGTGKNPIRKTRILGVSVSLIDMEGAVNTIMAWATSRIPNYVCVRDVHGIMLAQKDSEFLAIHERAGLVTPDGMPLVWLAGLRDPNVRRVCGSDLVDALCERSVKEGLRHFFYGGKPGVVEKMASALQSRYPGLVVAGVFSPPFGSLSKEADDAIVRKVASVRPQIVWVGLSTPKQEFWMRDHVGRIPGATLIGVGAAFDFHAGVVPQAPQWMRSNGLEWFHRFITEPRRLWRRYLILAPKFVWFALCEQIAGNYTSDSM
jgi:N-acetylglucosaminyldiphosphoundecaprenol N-acetyl-beta-D-mannosaminyltransferase